MARKHRIGTGKKRKPMTLAHRKAIGRGLARVKGETTDYDPYEKKGRKPGKGSHKASGTSRKMHDAEKALKARKNAPKTVESVTAKKLPKNGVSGGGKQANPKFLDKDAIRNEPGYNDFLDMQREMVKASPEARAAFMNQVEHARKAAQIDQGPDPENGEFGRNRAAQRRALHLEAMAEDMGLIKVENKRRAQDQADAIDNRAEEAKKRNDQRRKQGVKDRKASRDRAEKQRAEQEKREQEAQRAAELEAQKATAAEREAQRREAKIKQREKQEQALERAASQKAAARRAEYANWDDGELGEAHAAIMDKWGGDLNPENDDNYDFGVIAERERDRKRVNDLLDEMDDRAAERAGYADNRDYGTLAEKGQGHSATELGAAEQDYFAQIAGDRQAETELRDYLDQARQAHAARQAEYKAELDKLTAPEKGDKSDEAKAYRALKRKHDEARRLSNGAKKKHAALETRMRETYPDYDRPFYHTDDDELAELRDALSSVPDRDADTEQLLEQVQEELRYRDPAEIDGWADKNLREMTNLGKKYGHHMSEQEIVDRMALAGNERERAWNHSSAYQDKYDEWLTAIAVDYAQNHAGAGAYEDQFNDGDGRAYIEERLGVKSLANVTNAMHAAKLRGEGKDFLNRLGYIPTEANFRRHLRGETLKPYSEDSLKDVTHMGGTAKRRTKAEMNLARALDDATAGMTPAEKKQYLADRKRRAAAHAAEEARAAEARRAENKQRVDNALTQLGNGWSDDLGAIQLDGTKTRIHTNDDGTFTVKDRDSKGKGRTYDTLEKAANAARRKNKQATPKQTADTPAPAEKRTVTTEDGREIDMSAIPGAGKDTDKGMSDRVKAILAEQAARRAESDTPESTAEKTARENGTTPNAEKAAKAVAKAETTKAETDADKPAKRGRPKLNGPTLGERRAEATREQADRINTLKANRPATGDPARAQWDYDMANARLEHAEAVERFERDRMADLSAQNKPLTSVKKNISKAQAAQTKARADRDNALAKARAKHGDDAAETIRTTGGYVAPTKKKRAPKRDTKATKKRDADTKDTPKRAKGTQGTKKRDTLAKRRANYTEKERAKLAELKENRPAQKTKNRPQWEQDYAEAKRDLLARQARFEEERRDELKRSGKPTKQAEKNLERLNEELQQAEVTVTEKAANNTYEKWKAYPRFNKPSPDVRPDKAPREWKQWEVDRDKHNLEKDKLHLASEEALEEWSRKRGDERPYSADRARKQLKETQQRLEKNQSELEELNNAENAPAPANKVDVKPEEYEGKDTVLVWDGKRVHTFSAHDPTGKPDVKYIDRDAEAARAEVNDMAKKRTNSSVIMAVKKRTFALSKEDQKKANEYNASVDKLLQDVQKATEKRSAEIGEEKRKERFDQARKSHDEADARRAEAVERSRNVPPVDTSDLDLDTPLGKAERDYREADRAAKVAEAMRDATVAKGDQDTYQAHMAAAARGNNTPESREYHDKRILRINRNAQDAEVRADKRVEEAHAARDKARTARDKARTARDKARRDAEAMTDMSGGNGLQATGAERIAMHHTELSPQFPDNALSKPKGSDRQRLIEHARSLNDDDLRRAYREAVEEYDKDNDAQFAGLVADTYEEELHKRKLSPGDTPTQNGLQVATPDTPEPAPQGKRHKKGTPFTTENLKEGETLDERGNILRGNFKIIATDDGYRYMETIGNERMSKNFTSKSLDKMRKDVDALTARNAKVQDRATQATTPKPAPETPETERRNRLNSDGAPLDAENGYQKRGQWVSQTVQNIIDRDGDSQARYSTVKDDGTREYTPERSKQHIAIVDRLIEEAEADGPIPRDRKALFTGGIGGSGKGATLKERNKEEGTKYLTLNADDVKEIMAEMGMIEVPDNMAPMEGVALIHEESSDIANELARYAYGQGMNVVWDTTMGSTGSVQKRIDDLRENGYDEIVGTFTDVPLEVSVNGAAQRYALGMDNFIDGNGYGGRYVPENVIRKAETETPGVTRNKQVFNSLRDQFDSWEIWDNNRYNESGDRQPPLMVDSGTAPERNQNDSAQGLPIGQSDDAGSQGRGSAPAARNAERATTVQAAGPKRPEVDTPVDLPRSDSRASSQGTDRAGNGRDTGVNQRRAADMTEAERNTVIIAMNNRLIDGKIDAEEYERTVWDMEHPDGPDYDNRPMPEDGESDALHHVSNPDARIQITHSEDEGTLVHGTERDDNVGTAMRANGFKWSRNLKAWYRPRSRDKMPDEYKISRLRKALQEQGLDVGLDIDRRMGDAQHREDNRVQRSADRIEALGEKAQRKQAAAGAAWNAHFASVDALPPGGEPIKVGHHSEKRHRRALDRAWNSLGRAVAADEAAGEVQRRMEAAESHRDQRNRPYTVANRIEKLEKKIKKQRDYLNGAPTYRGGARRKPLTGDSRVRALNEIDTDMQDLQVQRAIFDQLKADGKVVDIHDLRPGDKIGHFDQWLPVEKVNKTSVTVQGGRKFKQGEVTKVKKITDEELAELNNAKKARKKKSDNGPHIVGEPIRKNHVLTDGTEKFNRGKLTRNGFTIKSTKGMYDGMYGGMFDVTGTPDKKFYVATPNALHKAKSLDEAREVIDRAAEDLNIDTSYMGHNELIGTPDAKLFEIALNPNRDPMGKARDILRGREQQGRLTYPDSWQAIAWQNSDFLSMSSEELQNIANGGGERAEAARRYLIGKFPGMFKDDNTGGGTLNGQHGLA